MAGLGAAGCEGDPEPELETPASSSSPSPSQVPGAAEVIACMDRAGVAFELNESGGASPVTESSYLMATGQAESLVIAEEELDSESRQALADSFFERAETHSEGDPMYGLMAPVLLIGDQDHTVVWRACLDESGYGS
ncbi:MAG: hypothetical protein LBS27_03190 [Bifidobacteriaceae bacterium]|jgi:hypothetical protein|nr:hypothetical protein [Bifidobacteriaceae bacterium]